MNRKPFNFKIYHKSSTTNARRGTISTPHGEIQTPAFVTVGTKASVKSLSPEDLDKTSTQFIFGNTYHLVLSPGADLIKTLGGIHAMSGIDKPMITDSGGFQVFSLQGRSISQHDEFKKNKPSLVKISHDGVEFRSHIDGMKFNFTPEFSIDAQRKIGADFIVAFDECVYNGASKKYTEKSMIRTHEWAQRSLDAFKGAKNQQMYGVIQGGLYEDLRRKSTQHISSLPFDAIALGGVSVGETNEELRQEISWVSEELGEDVRQRHLLGISTLDDVIFGVQKGLDTFDCVLPTRDARTGKLYLPDPDAEFGQYREIGIKKSIWKNNTEKINTDILGEVTFAYLHHLYKQRELLAYRLGTMNNLFMMERFFAHVRKAIENDTL